MITSEHIKLKPLSVTAVVEKKTRKILGTKVSQIGAFGLLAKISKKKYGARPNLHQKGLDELFFERKKYVHPRAHFESDEHNWYPKAIQTHCPEATHERFKGGRACIAGQGELKKLKFDPLFAINHTYAMFRANMNRLIRKTWCVTKKPERLQFHLNIYSYAFNQGLLFQK